MFGSTFKAGNLLLLSDSDNELDIDIDIVLIFNTKATGRY
jgi:hypothetical protein